MTRQEILNQITQAFGSVPQWLSGLPDPQLEHQWGLVAWVLSDSKLSARDKALVAFGVAAVITAHIELPSILSSYGSAAWMTPRSRKPLR